MAIELGSQVKDRISGFEGIVTGYVRYITGCNRCLVAPPVDKDGKLVDSHWFDEQRLTVTSAGVLMLDNRAAPGPDMEAPKR